MIRQERRFLQANASGFGLMEMVMVLVILVLLSGFVLNAYNNLSDRSLRDGRLMLIKSLGKAAYMYKEEFRKYPQTIANFWELLGGVEQAKYENAFVTVYLTRPGTALCVEGVLPRLVPSYHVAYCYKPDATQPFTAEELQPICCQSCSSWKACEEGM